MIQHVSVTQRTNWKFYKITFQSKAILLISFPRKVPLTFGLLYSPTQLFFPFSVTIDVREELPTGKGWERAARCGRLKQPFCPWKRRSINIYWHIFKISSALCGGKKVVWIIQSQLYHWGNHNVSTLCSIPHDNSIHYFNIPHGK